MESLVTTPTPASSLSLNMAPSKFALNSPGSGGNHLRQWGNFPQQCSSQLDWNCSSQLFAASPILPSGVVFSSNRLFCWWVQMSHAMVTNKSAIPSFVMSRSIKSRKVPFAASKRLTQLKSLHHTIFTASQSHKACFTSSGKLPQRWNDGFAMFFLFKRLALVGKQ